MKQECKFAAQCPIAKHFNDQGWQAMLQRYCYGKFERCHRHDMATQNVRVPEYVMPWDGTTELSRM